MKGYLWVVVLLALAAGVAACGGGNGAEESSPTPLATATAGAAPTTAPGGATPSGAESPAPTAAETAAATPTAFEAARDALRDRLEAIGDNITAVPDDIRDDLLAQCRELEEFIDADTVEDLCGAIEQAIVRNDPGLIDLVLARLGELEEE